MTGFGRGTRQLDGREITIELKSVNNRFLDIGLRLPRQLSFLEDVIRHTISEKLSRGHIDVYVNYRNTRTDSKCLSVDEAVARAYIEAGAGLCEKYGLKNDLTVSSVLRLPDVAEIISADEDMDSVSGLCREACSAAADALIQMRLAEGERLKKDLSLHENNLKEIIAKIEVRAPQVPEEYRQKLQQRINEFLGDTEVDRARLATEVAIFADRAAIDEEIARMHSHFEHFDGLLESEAPSGRQFDFLVQEMNRECNTIGSKANDSVLTDLVLSAKAEIEKLREQIQNIE